MKSRSVHLQYRFEPAGQRGAALDNPLFDLLHAVHEHGSIQRAATAMQASYRTVWGALKHWQEVLGEPLVHWVQGHPARLTDYAERLLWAETQARTRLVPHIEALRAELERVLEEARHGTQEVLTVFASHDLALPLLQQHSARPGAGPGLHIELRFAGSLDALRALAEGRCRVAGFHVPALAADSAGAGLFATRLKPLLKPGRHKLIGCARRTQGLVLARGNPLGLHSLADVARQRARFVQRQSGSATRLLTQHLLTQAGVDAALLADGGCEDSHSAVAAAVASGQADAGIAVQAVAAALGLAFLPLLDDDYFLVCMNDALELPAVRALRAALHDPAWQHSMATLPGYRPQQPGQVLSLTRALPWWQFRKAKDRARPAPG